MRSFSYKIKFTILGALLVPCFGRVALNGTGFEYDFYRYLIPLCVGGAAGYLTGSMKDKWLSLNKNLKKARDELEFYVEKRTCELTKSNEQLQQETIEHKQAKEVLKKSEEKFAKAFHHGPLLMTISSIGDGTYQEVNANFVRVTGYSKEESIGTSSVDLGFISKNDQNRLKLELVQNGRVDGMELKMYKKGGDTLYCQYSGEIITVAGKQRLLSIASDITGRKHAENLVRDLSQMLMQAQERERQMISCELHDSIAQNLSTLKLYCNRLFNKQSSPESDINGSPADVSNLIDLTITSVRDLAYDLRPPSLEHLGLVHSLEVFCEEFIEKNDIMVEFQAAGIHGSVLDWDTQINLYRLVTEGLNNVLKHAAASKANIKLVGAYPNIILRIEDNGRGFDVKERERSIGNEKKMGLRSMKERVNLLQGKMSIVSQLNKGTKIVINLPLKDK
jgi:PAS domain S-box-containing protein